MADAEQNRPAGDVRFPAKDERRIRNLAAITVMPTAIAYDEGEQQISLGSGSWGPVSQRVFAMSPGLVLGLGLE